MLYVSPLKALAVDVERNLRAPLAGIAQRRRGARRRRSSCPAIAIRTGDTPARRARALPARAGRHPDHDARVAVPAADVERARGAALGRHGHHRRDPRAGADQARRAPRAVARAARGARASAPLQRIGLSATQRPLDEVARFLGGAEPRDAATPRDGRADARAAPRRCADDAGDARGARTTSSRRDAGAVTLPAGHHRRRRPDESARADHRSAGRGHGEARRRPIDIPSGPASQGDARPSIWSAIHPRLLELIRAHQLDADLRQQPAARRAAGRRAERARGRDARALAPRIDRARRSASRSRIVLKAGALRALVATSSLELGIDMGAIDLVVQIEAPPSVASGLQRIGRGGHQVERDQRGRHLPEVPRRPRRVRGGRAGDARRRASRRRAIRATRSTSLAQQIVAMASMDDVGRRRAVRDRPRARRRSRSSSRAVVRGRARHAVGPLPVRRVRRAAAARHVGPRRRHASPRAKARSASRSPTAARFPTAGCTACSSLGAGPGAARVGELDEEMVFESRVGETFVLGASSWRIEEITHDRVLVSPAPGEPGKMPFWKGDRAGRPLELGLAIGTLMRELLRLPPAAAVDRLTREHDLDRARRREPAAVPRAIRAAAGAVPDDRDDRRSSACATSSATGASACCRRSAAAFTRRGRWPSAREDPRGDRHRRRDDVGRRRVRRAVSGRRTRRRIRALLLPDPDEVAGARRAAARRDARSSPRSSARTPARALLLPQAPARAARAAVAAAQARRRPAGGRVALRIVPGRCSRPIASACATSSTCRRSSTTLRRRPQPHASASSTVDSRDAVAVRRVAALQLRRQLPLRRRRAAGRAPRAGARGRSGAAARAARRRRAARAARSRRRSTRSSGSCSSSIRRYHAKSADGVHDMLLPHRRSDARRRSRRASALDDVAAVAATLDRARRVVARADRRRAALHRRRGRRALPRRARRAACRRACPKSLLQPVRDPLGDLALRYARTHAPFTTAEFARALRPARRRSPRPCWCG